MPIKEKFDDTDSKEEDDIALSILANYKEGLEKKEKDKEETKKEK